MMLPFFLNKKNRPSAASSALEKLSDRPSALIKQGNVRILSILTADAVMISPPGIGKDELIELLVRRLCACRGLKSPELLLAKVLEREQGISTTLDTGLSLPHARLDDIEDLVAAMAMVPQGIKDAKAGGLVIRLMFLFFSSSRSEMLPRHLQLLRRIASLFEPALIGRLCAADSPASAWEIIRQADG